MTCPEKRRLSKEDHKGEGALMKDLARLAGPRNGIEPSWCGAVGFLWALWTANNTFTRSAGSSEIS